MFQISLSLEERRVISRLYNPMSVSDLQQKYPFIPWHDHFRRIFPPKITIGEQEPVIVFAPTYIAQLEHILSSTPTR